MNRTLLAAGLLVAVLAAGCARPVARIIAIGPEEPVDIDRDGFFDGIRVPIELDVTEDGTYVITCALRAGRQLTSQRLVRELQRGIRTVTTSFDGAFLRQSRHDGTYRLTVAVSSRDWQRFHTASQTEGIETRDVRTTERVARRSAGTRAYRWDQFADLEKGKFPEVE